MTRLTQRLSDTTGWTEGQVQTAAIASMFALVLTVFGLGPALGPRPLLPSGASLDVTQTPSDSTPEAAATPAGESSPPFTPPPATPTPVSPAPFDSGSRPLAPGAPSPDPAPDVAAVPAPSEAAASELTVDASAWYSDDAGTPLTQIDNPVPEDGLPVAARAATTSRISVVRLAGSAEATMLQLKTTSAGQFQPDRAGVLLCPVLVGDWEPGPAQPMSSAPAYSADDCVAGEAGSDEYTFPLTTFDVRVGGAGFALVPVSDPLRPLFQVTFSKGRS